jgi:hypothetical protein
MMEICPAGPPKLMNPSLSQKAKARQKLTGWGSAIFTIVFTIMAGKESAKPEPSSL